VEWNTLGRVLASTVRAALLDGSSAGGGSSACNDCGDRCTGQNCIAARDEKKCAEDSALRPLGSCLEAAWKRLPRL